MRSLMIAVGIVLVAVLLALVATATEEMPGPDGSALWTYITKVNPYTEWKFWPDYEGMQEGQAPHGTHHKVYVNTQALESTGIPVEYGAIQVKESYKEDEFIGITLMYKISGYNPEAGDWFWANYSPTGKVKSAGKLRSCIGCHQDQEYNDYIFVHEIE